MTQERLNQPTSKQQEYLADLLDRARKHGMPRIDTELFTRDETSAWIAFLLGVLPREERKARTEVVRKEEGSESSSPSLPSLPFGITQRHQIDRVERDDRAQYLILPPLSQAPDGYRPPWDPAPDAWDHEHSIDTFMTADGHDVVFCTMCSGAW